MKLNLRSVDLNLLTIFDAIMSHGQMSKAAQQLHMTQPATSHALKRLRLIAPLKLPLAVTAS